MAVVADVTGDVEGEAEGGSADVEERNHLARSAVLNSSVVVAVGAPGMKGVHSLAVAGAIVGRRRRGPGADPAGHQPIAPEPGGAGRTGPDVRRLGG